MRTRSVGDSNALREIKPQINPKKLGSTDESAKVVADGFLGRCASRLLLLSSTTNLGTTISVMWPYTKVLHANIMTGEPALAFGTLLARHQADEYVI